MDDEEVITNDKGKITALVMIIIFIVLLIVAFLVLAILDISSESKNSKNYSTTTRRTMVVSDLDKDVDVVETTTTEAVEETTTVLIPDATTTTVAQTTNITTVKTTVGNTTKKTSAAPKITTEVTTTVVENPWAGDRTVIPSTDVTTYPDSLNDWEWQIVDLINKDRKTLGLNSLSVAKELRALAEEGADLMLGSSEEVVKNYLYGHNNYRVWTNKSGESPASLYSRAKSAVSKVTTNSSFQYLGVGVLYKQCGQSCMPTYYFVLIYE